MNQSEVYLPRIVVQPIGYDEAEVLLRFFMQLVTNFEDYFKTGYAFSPDVWLLTTAQYRMTGKAD